MRYNVCQFKFFVVQLLSCVQLFVIPWTAAYQASLSITNFQSLLKLISIELVMPSNHLSLCCPFSSCLQSFPASGSFPRKSVLRISWPKYWSFSFSISLSNKYSGLISFKTDWFDLLICQGTLKSLLQHHNSKASIFKCSAFFTTLGFIHNYWKNHSFDQTVTAKLIFQKDSSCDIFIS